MKVKDPHCGYEWDYQGSAEYYATCPRCHYLVNLKPFKIKSEKKDKKKEG